MTDFWRRLAAAPPGQTIQIALDPEGVPVFLGLDEWRHILHGHPEMALLRDLVPQAISEPDFVKQEDSARKFFHYFRLVPPELSTLFSVREHEVLVVVKYLYPPQAGGQRTGFVSTAYSPPLGEKRRCIPI